MNVVFDFFVFCLVDIAEILIVAFTVSVFRKQFFDIFANQFLDVPRCLFREVIFHEIRQNRSDEPVFAYLVGDALNNLIHEVVVVQDDAILTWELQFSRECPGKPLHEAVDGAYRKIAIVM